MSEYAADANRSADRDDDREPVEFGTKGIIDLASELAMSMHGATIDKMRELPELALAAAGTQMAILKSFDTIQPGSTWNDLPTDTAKELFENFAISYRGEN